MKKIVKVAMAGILTVASVGAFGACSGGASKQDTIYVDTNAYFAPFEYYDENGAIVGVDVDIMNMVGQKLGKRIEFVNTDFDVIIDNVASGKKYNCGAAGITVTPQRADRVDFSKPYYTSVQYVIYKENSNMFNVQEATDGTSCVFWGELMDESIGVQRDTTGHLYVDGEINGGVLDGKDAEDLIAYDDVTVAMQALTVGQIDVIVVDELPAKFLCEMNDGYVCYALYYDADTATEEEYAICVTKGQQELLDAINQVLEELGEDGINALVSQHLGITE